MYNPAAFDPRMKMAMLEHSLARNPFVSRLRIAVILLAICALAGSLATRFMVVAGPEIQRVTILKLQSPDAKRQHLLSKAVQWSAPPSSFALFQPPRSSVLTVSAVTPSTNLTAESWLHNRPPPAC